MIAGHGKPRRKTATSASEYRTAVTVAAIGALAAVVVGVVGLWGNSSGDAHATSTSAAGPSIASEPFVKSSHDDPVQIVSIVTAAAFPSALLSPSHSSYSITFKGTSEYGPDTPIYALGFAKTGDKTPLFVFGPATWTGDGGWTIIASPIPIESPGLQWVVIAADRVVVHCRSDSVFGHGFDPEGMRIALKERGLGATRGDYGVTYGTTPVTISPLRIYSNYK